MYVFSRRAIQARIDELEDALTLDQRRGLTHRLNKPGSQRFATTWETVLLSALNRIGIVTYEQPVSDGRAPDIAFCYRGSDEHIYAEITSVSDAGLNEQNPVARFWLELEIAAVKHGVLPNGLGFQIGNSKHGTPGNSKIKLLLPARADTQRVFRQYIIPFLKEINALNRVQHAIQIDEPGISITITYNRAQRFMSGGHASYKVTRSLRSNPLWHCLKSKVRQLKGVATDDTKGIIVCDAGCELLSQSGHHQFNADDIIRDFLRRNSSIRFVASFTTEIVSSNRIGETPPYRVVAKLWPSKNCSPSITRLLRNLLNDIVENLPTPVIDAQNGATRCNVRGYGLGNFGGFQMGIGNGIRTVRIPSRSLLALLSGQMSPSEFLAPFQQDIGAPGQAHKLPNPFQRAVLEGRMINRVRVDPAVNENDDWITFEFGDPDPLFLLS